MRAIADEQVLPDLDAQLAQAFDLGHERHGIDHDAIADDASFSAPQNSRRDQVQNVFRPAMDDGVPGVVPALAADDDVRLRGENVDDLALAFIAPLRANQNGVRHEKRNDNKLSRCIWLDTFGTAQKNRMRGYRCKGICGLARHECDAVIPRLAKRAEGPRTRSTAFAQQTASSESSA